jgi:hypothetical protein
MTPRGIFVETSQSLQGDRRMAQALSNIGCSIRVLAAPGAPGPADLGAEVIKIDTGHR